MLLFLKLKTCLSAQTSENGKILIITPSNYKNMKFRALGKTLKA